MSVSAFPHGSMGGAPVPDPEVSPNTSGVNRTINTGTCYAGVEYNNSGAEWASTNTGAFTSSRGDWLDVGNSSDVWVSRTINSGSLNWEDPGTGRHNLGTTRRFGIQSSVGLRTANITVNFYDAASGGSLLGSATYLLSAEQGIN